MIMDWKLKIENFANLINGTFLVGVVHPLNNTLEVIAAPSIIGDTWTKLLLFFLKYQLNRLPVYTEFPCLRIFPLCDFQKWD